MKGLYLSSMNRGSNNCQKLALNHDRQGVVMINLQHFTEGFCSHADACLPYVGGVAGLRRRDAHPLLSFLYAGSRYAPFIITNTLT